MKLLSLLPLVAVFTSVSFSMERKRTPRTTPNNRNIDHLSAEERGEYQESNPIDFAGFPEEENNKAIVPFVEDENQREEKAMVQFKPEEDMLTSRIIREDMDWFFLEDDGQELTEEQLAELQREREAMEMAGTVLYAGGTIACNAFTTGADWVLIGLEWVDWFLDNGENCNDKAVVVLDKAEDTVVKFDRVMNAAYRNAQRARDLSSGRYLEEKKAEAEEKEEKN